MLVLIYWLKCVSGVCLFLRYSDVDAYSCDNFVNGCPNADYYSDEIYKCKCFISYISNSLTKYPTVHQDIYLLRHYVTRWQSKCSVELFVSLELVHYHHSSAVKVLVLWTAYHEFESSRVLLICIGSFFFKIVTCTI